MRSTEYRLVYYVPLHSTSQTQPGIERVQALADITRSALCCHSNETHVPTANPLNTAQLEGTPTILPSISGSLQCGNAAADRPTHRHTDGRGQYTFRLGYASRKM